MKFSCELNGIHYVIKTEQGTQTDAKYHFMLSSTDKKRLEKGDVAYFHAHIQASCEDTVMEFWLQGLPLSIEAEEQVEDIEDFFENLCIFSKVEHMFDLDEREEKFPHWGEGDAKLSSED